MPPKSSFSWDSETLIGSLMTGEKSKITVNFAQKGGKGYITIVKHIKKGNQFSPIKGIALPYTSAQQISALIDRAIKEGQKYDLKTNWK